jgi:hypothetical protein
MTHQEGLTCAAKLAGGLKPKQTVCVRLEPTNRDRLDSKPSADVWIDTYGLSVADLADLERQIRELGYEPEFSGGEMNVVRKTAVHA